MLESHSGNLFFSRRGELENLEKRMARGLSESLMNSEMDVHPEKDEQVGGAHLYYCSFVLSTNI